MSTRFLTNAVITLAGGFIVVASFAFAPDVTAWIALAIAIAVMMVIAAGQLDTQRGAEQRLLDAITGAVAIVALVFSRVFTGSSVQWLMFALALGYVALAYAGLTLNEIAAWRAERGLAPLRGLGLLHGGGGRRLAA